MKAMWAWATIIAAIICFFITSASGEEGQTGIASWYSTEESKGRMANGERLRDVDFLCATWAYPFGSWLRVVNVENNKSVEVVVKDRGPGQPKCSGLKGEQRIIDLSKVAFKKLAPLSSGLISVRVEQVR